MTPVLEARGLTKYYGTHRGLEGLDLTVEPGEIFGYLGPNGAGKTTTIRLLLDLIRPTKGSVSVLGRDPRKDGVEVRARIGYLPGELAFDGGRERVQTFLEFCAKARNDKRRTAAAEGNAGKDRTDLARAKELAERLELDTSRKIGELSKGNKQKVGLVQAFMHEPDLLILDEPTSGLDPLMQQEFLHLVREARDAGQTVFMSSHVLAEVQSTADRVGIVRQGELVAVERVESLGRRAIRHVQLHFAEPVPTEAFANLDGVRDVTAQGPVLHCTVDGRLDPLVKAAAKFTVVDLISAEPDLEETFLAYYYNDQDEQGDRR